MNKLKNWLEYRRQLSAWRKTRPYSGFNPLDGRQQMQEIVKKLHNWELAKPTKSKLTGKE